MIDEFGIVEKRKPIAGPVNIDQFVNLLILPDDFVQDESGLILIFIKAVNINHLSVKVASDSKFQVTGMARRSTSQIL